MAPGASAQACTATIRLGAHTARPIRAAFQREGLAVDWARVFTRPRMRAFNIVGSFEKRPAPQAWGLSKMSSTACSNRAAMR